MCPTTPPKVKQNLFVGFVKTSLYNSTACNSSSSFHLPPYPFSLIILLIFSHQFCSTPSCSFQSNLPHLFSSSLSTSVSSSLLSTVGDIGFWGGGTVAVLASARRAGMLPATEHHSGNQSHAVGFISNQPVS